MVMTPFDTVVTTIDLNANVNIQTARGSVNIDEDGARQATILFPQGTTAEMTLPDGTIQSLSTLDVRATEYTVGPNGPESMPAALPPTSGYTYAVEFSVDEAVAAGAKEVRFNQPLINYVENFLNFPVGGIVPSGFYDREKAAWIPSDNGLVIEILNINANGLAEIDIDGSGAPADQASLDALGVTNAEQGQLAVLYMAGQSLWRVPIPHFSPWDYNWPYGPPSDAKAPNLPKLKFDLLDDADCNSGSIIESQNQTLGEALDIVGAPYSLHYKSDRAPDRLDSYTIKIPLSDNNIPASLKRIGLKINIAGRQFMHAFPALPNQIHTFIWDGKDAYGRTLQGQQVANVNIGYVYDAVYLGTSFTQGFGRFSDSGIPISGSRARGELTIWQEYNAGVGSWDARSQGLGGWSLNIHHAYAPHSQTLYLGNGNRRTATNKNDIITTITSLHPFLINSRVKVIEGVAVGPDGIIYIIDRVNEQIRSFGTDGVMTTVAGNGIRGFSGDGGPAINAQLFSSTDVALGPDGSLYIADQGNHAIRKVTPDGIINTVAGDGAGGRSGDGGPATSAQLLGPTGVAIGPDGSIYIADRSLRIRRVDPDGIINTVAGNGIFGFSGDGGPAINAQFLSTNHVALGPDGSLYIVDGRNDRVRKVTSDGIINTVVGNGTRGFSGDGGPATLAQISAPRGITVGPDGSIYMADLVNNRIRRVGPDGIITTVAGIGISGYSGDGGPATNAHLSFPQDVALGPDGSIYIADSSNIRIRKVAPTMPDFSASDIAIASEDGSELYQFNLFGQHLRTFNTLTQSVKYNFTYNNQGLLTLVQDGDGNITTIQRNFNGDPTAIIAPDGQQTSLNLDFNGYLSDIADPAGDTTQFTYTTRGLMTSLTNPRGKINNFTYDLLGRLIKDEDPAGGFWALFRTESDSDDNYTVDLTSAMGRTTTYFVDTLLNRDERRVTIDPSGLQTETLIGTNGSRITTAPDGTVTNLLQGPDPRWSMQAPLNKNMTTTTPGGLIFTLTTDRTVTLADPDDLLSLLTQTDTITINNRIFTSVFDTGTNTTLSTTPAGRQTTTTIDSQGRVLNRKTAGLDPVNFSYDLRGRLATITEGSGFNDRASTLTYNNEGFIGSITDPLLRTVSFLYDLKGQVVTEILPDLREIHYTYDANGNVTSVTPPGRPAHNFTFTSVDLEQEYIPPFPDPLNPTPDPRTFFTYNLDKQLALITRPDSQTVSFGYDTGGRLSSITLPRGLVSYAYSTATGNLSTITAPDGGTISFAYDASLLLNSSWTGQVVGSISRTYDNDFRIISRSVNGGSIIGFGYDNDGLLTQAGNLILSRNAQNGLLTGTTIESVSDTIGYNSFREVNNYNASFNTSEFFATQFTRDKLGRITQKVETVSGQTHTFDYSYDLGGRLTDVIKDGTFNIQYQYDDNGNRISRATSEPVTTIGTYDNQDRLLSYGDFTYTYTANGELQTKTETTTNETTFYNYDVLGNLMSVALSDGTLIEYIIDGNNRRIGKKINGVLAEGFLYKDHLNPIAELDGGGNVVSRFVYGSRLNVPDYMIRGGGIYRIISDHLGSPRIVIDTTTGQIVQQIEYDEFGNIEIDTNPGFQPFGFAGGIYDKDTGLTIFGARDYDPHTGRWATKDPIGFAGGDTNLYGYVLNDPVNFIDPWGLIAIKEVGNIIFNETRSLSGEGIQEARLNIAHAIFNADTKYGKNRSRYAKTAPSTVGEIPKSEQAAYEASQLAAKSAYLQRTSNCDVDPTQGATNFNFRNSSSRKPFFGLKIRTQVGPLNNSYPTTHLNASGVYANTYGGE